MDSIAEIYNNFLDIIVSHEVTFGNAVFKLVVSMILGAMIGSERKRKGQIAGVRTFALISMGACMAMLLSIYVPQEYLGLKNGDPGRIAAQVITGVGFLGCGAIIQMKGSVRGLTTAAGIWIAATIGMGVGVGMYVESLVATILVLVILLSFEWFEHRRRLIHESKVINIKVEGILNDIDVFKKVFDENGIHLSTYYVDCNYENNECDIRFVIMSTSKEYLSVFEQLRCVCKAKSIRLASQADI